MQSFNKAISFFPFAVLGLAAQDAINWNAALEIQLCDGLYFFAKLIAIAELGYVNFWQTLPRPENF